MFRRPGTDDHDTEDLLGRAMRALPDPQISPEFNDRSHRELSQDVRVNAPYLANAAAGVCRDGGFIRRYARSALIPHFRVHAFWLQP